MNIVVIAALEEEALLLRESLSHCKIRQFIGHQFHEGLYQGIPVVVAKSGVGKVNAAVVTTAAIARFVPRLVINTGSAGALSSEMKQGDIVIAKELAHHDVDLRAFGYQYGQVAQDEPRYRIPPDLLEPALRVAQSLQERYLPHRLDTGLIVSGEQFVDKKEHKDRIRQHFPDALAVEMEGAAIAQTCRLLKTPYLIVRAISDLADQAAELSFEQFLPLAAQHSAEVVQALIQHFGHRSLDV